MNNPILHLSICCVLLLSRLLLPYGIYLFVPYTISFALIYFISNRNFLSISNFFQVFKSNIPFFILSFGFIIGIIFSTQMPFYLLKEVFAMFMLFLLIFLFYCIIDTKKHFQTFLSYFKKGLYLIVFFTSILAIFKFNLELADIYFDFLRTNSDKYYPVGTTLIIDYNFYSLMNIVCFVFLFFDLIKIENDKKKNIYLQLLMFLIYNNVFFSSSRRGWMLLLFVNGCLFLYSFYKILKKRNNFKFPLIYFGFVFSFTFLFFSFFRTPHSFQDKVLTSLHFNKEYFNFEINRISNRYLTIFFPNKTIQLTNPYLNGESTGTIKEDNSQINTITPTAPTDTLNVEEAKSEERVNIKTVLSDTNNLSGNRMIRIKYAMYLFKESSLQAKIFGSGFDYMKAFGNHFFTKRSLPFHYDYPHNPFLSSLLYGGIIGLLITVLFAAYNLVVTIKLISDIPEFIIIYVFFLYFIFFSFNSLFGVPEFLFFTIVSSRIYFLNNRTSDVK